MRKDLVGILVSGIITLGLGIISIIIDIRYKNKQLEMSNLTDEEKIKVKKILNVLDEI